MPISGAKYRMMTTKSGKKMRLAWKGGRVVEAKNMMSGDTHTQKEFMTDAKRRARRKAKKSMKSLKK